MITAARVELGEYERRIVPATESSPADERLAERLRNQRELAARLDVRWLANGTAEIIASSWVGVVRFSTLEVHVVPKLVGGSLRVLRMLEYALGVRMLSRLPVDRPLAADGTDLFDLVCLLLTEEAKALLRNGLLQDYRQTDDTLEVLRGRLRYREQYLRRFGQLDRLDCRFDEYDSDTPDNQLVAAALDAVRRRSKEPDIRFAALRLAGMFGDACEPPTMDADSYVRVIRYDRRNGRYRPAHELSKLVLRGVAFDDMFDTAGGHVTAFMINMNTVFERFLLRLVSEALDGHPCLRAAPHERIRAVIRDDDTGRTYTTIDPDLVIEDTRSGERVPIDVKYKLYDARKLSMGDINQAFLYAFALGHAEVRRAAIVFPASRAVTGPVLSVHPVGGPAAARIVAAGLDVPGALDALSGPDRPQLMHQVRAMVVQLTGLGR